MCWGVALSERVFFWFHMILLNVWNLSHHAKETHLKGILLS